MLTFHRYIGGQGFKVLDNIEAMNYGLEEDPKFLTVYGKINVYRDLVSGEIFYCLNPPYRVKLKLDRETFTYKIRDFYDKSLLFTTKEGFEDFMEQYKEKFKNPKQFEMVEREKSRDKFCIYDKI